MSKAKNTRISSWITKLQKRLMGLVDTGTHSYANEGDKVDC